MTISPFPTGRRYQHRANYLSAAMKKTRRFTFERNLLPAGVEKSQPVKGQLEGQQISDRFSEDSQKADSSTSAYDRKLKHSHQATAQPLGELSKPCDCALGTAPYRVACAPLPISMPPTPRGDTGRLPSPSCLKPPVTRAGLSQLDFDRLENDPWLRHEITFNPMCFRRDSDDNNCVTRFWTTLKEELTELFNDRSAFSSKHGRSMSALRMLLKTVEDIMQTFPYPEDPYELNAELLMQQFYDGTDDLDALALWLDKVLSHYCAPTRDELVKSMRSHLSRGHRESDPDSLVKGMSKLLSLLEAIILDLVNDYLHRQRNILVEGTIRFQQHYYMEQERAGKIDTSAPKAWYKRAAKKHSKNSVFPARTFGNSGAFFEGLIQLVLPSCSEDSLPNTFFLDADYIFQARSDILDAINLSVCMKMYRNLCKATVTRKMACDLYQSLELLLESVEPGLQPDERWESIAPSIALEIFRSAKEPKLPLDTFEKYLTSSIRDKSSNLYQKTSDAFERQFTESFSLYVYSFWLMGLIDFLDSTANAFSMYKRPMEHITFGLAQRGFFNWQVYGSLVYVNSACPNVLALDEPT